ncbi:succinylglutamate desuccinylase/aspartoacylase family protein [Catalinimonas niigatensis]|uniref:succinylglutamate desuccinylase/aspartoacylase family protein n=1 Tax=Catalinimonas niigatensis TaxID=1397264 RepID=UPI0026660A1C|nr:succinylglutamate desuccinylase/aspartoacylase family protein [Catalinimonas niigatensis]WPP48440.1 succinylglutamate desuccinylase/aspartoacylase family protein [Catalinimonas niigatensis]
MAKFSQFYAMSAEINRSQETSPSVLHIAGHAIEPGQELLIDLNFARLPSRTEIVIPILVSRALLPGPILLLMAGLHGDEINGIEIVRRIRDQGFHRPDKGTVICIPLLNIFGFVHFSRTVPDGKDVNRSFPGSKNGSLASRVAYVLMKEIIPLVDYGIDFHTGGASRANIPQVRCNFDNPLSKELAVAFDAPYTLHSKLIKGSLRHAAHKRGKSIIIYEGGESLRLNEKAIQVGINGTRRLMKHLGMLKTQPKSPNKSIIINKRKWIRARHAGLFHSLIKLGAIVKKGENIGYITDPIGNFQIYVKSPEHAHVIGLNNNPVINQGDALLHLGIIK